MSPLDKPYSSTPPGLTFQDLPIEITQKIAYCLDTKSVFALKKTCTALNQVLKKFIFKRVFPSATYPGECDAVSYKLKFRDLARQAEENKYFICHFESSKIQDEEARYLLAQIAAKHYPWELSEHIVKFNLSEPYCFKIACISAVSSGWATSLHFLNYGITDEKNRFRIACISAASNGWGTSKHIQKYGITDENNRCEVACISAAQNGDGTSENIQKYDITDEKDRFKVACISAKQNAWGTSQYILNYDITNQNYLDVISSIRTVSTEKKFKLKR